MQGFFPPDELFTALIKVVKEGTLLVVGDKLVSEFLRETSRLLALLNTSVACFREGRALGFLKLFLESFKLLFNGILMGPGRQWAH